MSGVVCCWSRWHGKCSFGLAGNQFGKAGIWNGLHISLGFAVLRSEKLHGLLSKAAKEKPKLSKRRGSFGLASPSARLHAGLPREDDAKSESEIHLSNR